MFFGHYAQQLEFHILMTSLTAFVQRILKYTSKYPLVVCKYIRVKLIAFRVLGAFTFSQIVEYLLAQ